VANGLLILAKHPNVTAPSSRVGLGAFSLGSMAGRLVNIDIVMLAKLSDEPLATPSSIPVAKTTSNSMP
jgi:hypothetical protein